MKYEKLLETDEWEAKRYEILDRDNYTCQDCRCRGINNNIFFPICNISDLDIFLPDCLFNGEDLHSFCNHIQWKGQHAYSNSLMVRVLKEHFYVYQMVAIKGSIWKAEFQFEFAADSRFSKLDFQRNDRSLCLQYKDKIIDGYLAAFKFKEYVGQRNYAAINYSCSNNLEKLELNILFGNKYFHFYFPFSCMCLNNEGILFKFTPLNVSPR